MIGHPGLIAALKEARTDHLAILAICAVIAGDDLEAALARIEASLGELPTPTELRKEKKPRLMIEIATRVHEFGPEIITGLRTLVEADAKP